MMGQGNMRPGFMPPGIAGGVPGMSNGLGMGGLPGNGSGPGQGMGQGISQGISFVPGTANSGPLMPTNVPSGIPPTGLLSFDNRISWNASSKFIELNGTKFKKRNG